MRLDQYLVLHGYVKTRSQASDVIKRGYVKVNDDLVTKPGYEVKEPSIKMIEKPTFVSRAGEKLQGALIDFNIDLTGKIMIDVGSSTGGFTDCAIQSGIKKVYAYDVGTDQMDPSLSHLDIVELHEGTNILDVDLPFADIVTIDVSFTSILPIMNHFQGFQGEMVCLIKPQFEAGPMSFKQGVLKDLKIHQKILSHVTKTISELGFHIVGLKKSVLKGKMGNQEYVLYINPKGKMSSIDDIVRGVLC